VLFLLAQRPTPTNGALLAAFRRLGIEAALLLVGDAQAREGDTVLVRLRARASADGIEPGLAQADALADQGVLVLNRSGCLTAAHDKLATAIRLARAALPHPRTLHVDWPAALPEVKYPTVVKPRFGGLGRDVVLCESPDGLTEALERLSRRGWFERQGVLVQELVPSASELRVIVAAGTVAGALERVAAPGQWRTSASVGTCRPLAELPDEAAETALLAAGALGCDLVGIDLLEGPTGYVVLDANGAAEFTAAYGLGGADPFEEAARALLEDRDGRIRTGGLRVPNAAL
jgi:RimK family alpha-L-glutamate ligase